MKVVGGVWTANDECVSSAKQPRKRDESVLVMRFQNAAAGLRSIGYLATSFLMYAMALDLSGIFLPIYYLENGLPIAQILEILSVTFLVVGILPTLLLRTIPRYFERAMTFGMLLATVFFLALLTTRDPIILGVTYGFFNALFWPGFNLLMFRLSELEARAATISFLTVLLPTITAVTGPLLGGYLIASFNFSAVFYLGIIFMLIGGVASLKVKVQKTKMKLEFTKFSRSSPVVTFAIVFITSSLAEYYWLGYPLLLYRLTGSVFGLGLLASVTSLLSSVSSVFIGRISDIKKRRIEFGVISLAASALYLLALAFVSLPVQLLPVSVIGGLATAFATPSFVLLADSFQRDDYASILVLREIFIMVGRFGNVLIMFIFIASYQFQNYFLTLAISTAVTIPIYMSLRFRYKLR
jgi:MFS family permease